MSGIESSGTSTIVPASLVTEGATVGDTVTDSTVNTITDTINKNGDNLENLA